MLNYTEADFWLRSGEDVCRKAWPDGDFVRIISGDLPQVEGYDVLRYTPSAEDQNATDWRRA